MRQICYRTIRENVAPEWKISFWKTSLGLLLLRLNTVVSLLEQNLEIKKIKIDISFLCWIPRYNFICVVEHYHRCFCSIHLLLKYLCFSAKFMLWNIIFRLKYIYRYYNRKVEIFFIFIETFLIFALLLYKYFLLMINTLKSVITPKSFIDLISKILSQRETKIFSQERLKNFGMLSKSFFLWKISTGFFFGNFFCLCIRVQYFECHLRTRNYCFIIFI